MFSVRCAILFIRGQAVKHATFEIRAGVNCRCLQYFLLTKFPNPTGIYVEWKVRISLSLSPQGFKAHRLYDTLCFMFGTTSYESGVELPSELVQSWRDPQD